MLNRIKLFFSTLSFVSEKGPDLYLVSYPKSGRTWLRALIGKYLFLKYGLPEVSVLNAKSFEAEGLLKVGISHDGSQMVARTSYKNLSLDKSKYKNKVVVLLGRDVKDTLVSAYFQATKRKKIFDGGISEFIRNDEFGINKILTFYEGWVRNLNTPRKLAFISYEQMHEDVNKVLADVLKLMGEKKVDKKAVQEAVDACSFDKLRSLEKKNNLDSSILRPADKDDPESYKVRKGQVGGYSEYLSEKDIEYIDEVIKNYKFDFQAFSS